MQRQGPSRASAERPAIRGLLRLACADRLAQGTVGEWQAAPVRLSRQHLQALQDAGGGGMAITGGRIVIAHRGMILVSSGLTLS
jgi:hypothetical protein